MRFCALTSALQLLDLNGVSVLERQVRFLPHFLMMLTSHSLSLTALDPPHTVNLISLFTRNFLRHPRSAHTQASLSQKFTKINNKIKKVKNIL